MQSFDLIQGDSYTLGIKFDTAYDIDNLQGLKVNCFGLVFVPVVTSNPRIFRVEIASEITITVLPDFYPLEIFVDDGQIGIKKIQAGIVLVKKSLSSHSNNSINIGYNLIINLKVNYQATTDILLATLIKGDKGESGSSGVANVNLSVVGIKDDSNATFISTVLFNPDLLVIYLNGQRLHVVNDYITTGTNIIIFNVSPSINDIISIDIF